MPSIGHQPQQSGSPHELVIRVSSGHGEGPTQLAAFDAALRRAGVADFNLIRLSSVIPPGSTVVRVDPHEQLRGGFGDALYCVYAAGWVTEPGAEVWAGVGWNRRDDGSGAGLFVEHTSASEDELRQHLTSTLCDMAEGREAEFTYEGEVLGHAHCVDRPACAVAVATYRSAGWDAL